MNQARSLLAILLLSSTAHGAGQSLAGMGALTCEDYLKYRKTPSEVFETAVISWVQGFLSGQNIERMERVKREQQKAAQYLLPVVSYYLPHLDNYCQEIPQAPIWMGAVALDHELEKSIDSAFRAPDWKP